LNLLGRSIGNLGNYYDTGSVVMVRKWSTVTAGNQISSGPQTDL